ncbi:MAG: hypothetical protein IJA72_03465 [Clostridia bacterium]|nr:hypothetical protein [Clostridia bacterium]
MKQTKYSNLTPKEFDYITASVNDCSQDIRISLFGDRTGIYGDLIEGSYWLTFNSSRDAEAAYDELVKIKGLSIKRDNNFISFTDYDAPIRIHFPISLHGGATGIVRELRRQVVMNKRALQKDAKNNTLIQQDIKCHTNFGEDYNRTSFYDTIDECLMDEEDLIIDEKAPNTDKDVVYAKLMRLEQLSAKIDDERLKINAERKNLTAIQNQLNKQ